MKNSATIKNNTNNKEIKRTFDEFFIKDNYIIIDIEELGTNIGREICNDLSEDKEYIEEDIFARIENFTDNNINNLLYEEVEEYLRNNFNG